MSRIGQATMPRIGMPLEWVERKGTTYEQQTRAYIDAIFDAGGLPIPIPVTGKDGKIYPSVTREYFDLIDGLLIPGGVDVDPREYGQDRHPDTQPPSPEKDAMELLLLELADDDKVRMPILAVCRGAQLLNVKRGGTLHQHIPDNLPGSQVTHLLEEAESLEEKQVNEHEVAVDLHSRLGILMKSGVLTVNSYHHQSIDELGHNLVVTAHSVDGVKEAVEDTRPDRFVVGVQWHPEAMEDFGRLFSSLVEASAAYVKPNRSVIGKSRAA